MPLMDCRCPLPEVPRNPDHDDFGDDGGNDGDNGDKDGDNGGDVGDDHDGNCTDCHGWLVSSPPVKCKFTHFSSGQKYFLIFSLQNNFNWVRE